ncbi:hypothetical protein CLOP_g18161 [Closterium sp. NIES-67]|nr:hypothetical protein CLOP_g18161 [Closterium sp. NIES-67]
MTSDSFLSACFNSKADIISLDVSHYVPSRPSPAAIKAVMQAGRVFEFSYGPVLSDRSLLAPLLQGIKEVSEVTRGKCLILSCGATAARQLKRPADVAALLSLAGLTRHQIRVILTVTPKKLLARAESRRQQNQQQRPCVVIHPSMSSAASQAAIPQSPPDTALLSSLFSSLTFLRPPGYSSLSAPAAAAAVAAAAAAATSASAPQLARGAGDAVTTDDTAPDSMSALKQKH